jgi:hypothetical protein
MFLQFEEYLVKCSQNISAPKSLYPEIRSIPILCK